jgi:hypothetical protein
MPKIQREMHFSGHAGGPGAASDIIALYVPATANPSTTLFVKYITGNQISGYVGSGTGSYL